MNNQLISSASDRSRDPWWRYAGLAIVSAVFTTAGPLAIILSVAGEAGLPTGQISSWVFATFFFNGLASILFSSVYRQPLAFLWTIPGTILVGPALARYGLPTVVGAYMACSVLLLALGATRVLPTVEKLIPKPVVMGMIAGVFLKFGLQLVQVSVDAPRIAAVMVAVFLLVQTLERQRGQAPVPPVLAALAAGLAVLPWTGFTMPTLGSARLLAEAHLNRPVWNTACLLELVLPLVITVVFVQNAQGIAALRSAGHRSSLRLATLVSGLLSIVCGLFGACPSTLAGPSNAILVSAGTTRGHYLGGIFLGGLCVAIGIFAPVFTTLMTALPTAFIAALAGLAMLGVLERALGSAFGGSHMAGATVAFLIAASQVEIASVGAPFWGLVAGTGLSLALGEHRQAG